MATGVEKSIAGAGLGVRLEPCASLAEVMKRARSERVTLVITSHRIDDDTNRFIYDRSQLM